MSECFFGRSGNSLVSGQDCVAEVTVIHDVDLQCCQVTGLCIGGKPEHNYIA
jgi:hypothetical protein